MAVLFYIVCTALRLARFNVQSKTVEKLIFTGLPSPMASGLMFSPVLLFSKFGIMPDEKVRWFFLIAAPIIGLLMVSNITYWKYPKFKLSGPFNALVVSAIIIAAIVTNPEIMVICVVYLYCLFGLVLYLVKQFREKPVVDEEVKIE